MPKIGMKRVSNPTEKVRALPLISANGRKQGTGNYTLENKKGLVHFCRQIKPAGAEAWKVIVGLIQYFLFKTGLVDCQYVIQRSISCKHCCANKLIFKDSIYEIGQSRRY